MSHVFHLITYFILVPLLGIENEDNIFRHKQEKLNNVQV